MDKHIDIQIRDKPLDVEECTAFVTDERCGGINVFVGTVRRWNNDVEVTHLEFECYTAMALSELQKIADTAIDRFDAKKISIHHRVGTVRISEIAVIIAVATKHRSAAFAACQYIIDTLKSTVPIWKKEYCTDGSYWVNATP